MFWKLNSWFFQMAMKADACWFPGWDKGHIYQQEEMLIKSQVTRMHVLNICVSNGFIYWLYMTRFVCTLHNISSWFNLKLTLQKLKWHVSREINCTTIKETASPSYCSYSIKKLTAKRIMILLRAILEIHCNWRYYPKKSPKKPSWANTLKE